jgi:hypothetical protein
MYVKTVFQSFLCHQMTLSVIHILFTTMTPRMVVEDDKGSGSGPPQSSVPAFSSAR